jgi:putative intracellular protease/amidase
MAKKILVVLTSHEKYPDMNRATGVWLGEAVHFVEKVEEAGFEVDYASPEGGYVPIDPHSLEMAESIDWEWYGRRDFMDRLGATKKLSEVNPTDYAAIYYVGGHGVMWDFPDDVDLQRIARAIWENGGVVSSVCHGVVGLLNIKLSDGSTLIDGRRLTGFSNEEEKLAELDSHVPFMTETELRRRGAKYQKANQAWAPFAIADGRLITGQNPASGGKVGELVVEALRG